MSHWNQYRLTDILCGVDLSLLEEEIPEKDLERMEEQSVKEEGCGQELEEKAERRRSRRRIALISGLAAGSVALTGAVVLAFRKKDMIKKIA